MTAGRAVGAAGRFALVAAVVAVGLALATPDRSPAVRADLFVVALGGLGVLEALRWLRRSLPARPDVVAPLVRLPRRHRSSADRRTPALRQLELLVALSSTDGHTASARLRPRLAALAAVWRAPLPHAALDDVLGGGPDDPVALDRLAAAIDELADR